MTCTACIIIDVVYLERESEYKTRLELVLRLTAYRLYRRNQARGIIFFWEGGKRGKGRKRGRGKSKEELREGRERRVKKKNETIVY